MKTFDAYKKVKKLPFGNRIFTFFMCKRVPYFGSISPLITVMEEGRVEVEMTQHRAVHNHIKSIHAIAVCNLCEIAMGMVCESTIPDNLRWIPAGMDVKYLKITKGKIRAVATVKKEDFKPGNLGIPVEVFNSKNELVTKAIITINIKEK
jgi:uncharacterized protein (TIGR00369 family)